MSDLREQIQRDLDNVRVWSVDPRDPVRVDRHPEGWRCIGVGNTAAVFQAAACPGLAIKVYAEPFADVAREEAAVYEQLGDSPYFPTFHGKGDHFVLIGYRPGVNIYDCLVQGIYIPERVILDVEEAIRYARSRGLTPSDIHVRNVIVHEGRGYLIDVSDYRRQDKIKRWEILKKAYYDYYVDLYRPGRTVPPWILETIRKWYKTAEGEQGANIWPFADRIRRMFF